jgi:carboxypeptidase Taq
MDTSTVDSLFKVMNRDLQELLTDIARSGQPDDSFLFEQYPEDRQDRFGKEVLRDMGFDFSRGVMGQAAHPFTSAVGCDDIRITTRYTEASVASPLFSTIHEGGHALYEQGASNPLTYGTSLAGGASYAFHESQSRLWENIIGHSPAFWERYYPRFRQMFPSQTAGVDLRSFVKGINKVMPSAIRVNADEVTYGLHIILRFELEQALLEGTVSLDDLPEMWDEKMVALLGVRPQTVTEGVLQDVHWAGETSDIFPPTR